MVTEARRQVLELFREGRNLYKQMDFAGAFRKFDEALAADPDDGPSKVYRARCKHYVDNPPPEDWDGVFVYNTK
ncbi:MAG: hypothetical protein EA382_08775 [Spirochaetaceae bacterium]|nr:MAG: hypothetical protein EA382_08775 [Spirochaetaceae bacterium]